MSRDYSRSFFFFFNDTATTEIYTLSLHDALPISRLRRKPGQEIDERGRVRRAMRCVGGGDLRKMILEGRRPRHSSSSQVSETRSLPKLWFFSLPTTRKPAAWYRRRAARSSL